MKSSVCASVVFLTLAIAQSALAAQPGSVDPTFDPGRGALSVGPGLASGVLIQPDGKIIVGGNSNGVGLEEVPPIVRFHSDGSLDRSFDSSDVRPATISANGSTELVALALQSDGGVLVTPGQMNNSYGSRALVRLDASGRLNPAFNPQFSGTPPRVHKAVVLSDGKIIVNGSFTAINGIARLVLARLNADGSVDQSFNPARSGAFDSLPDGKIIVGSDTIYRLNADGSLDPTFVADVPPNQGDGHGVGVVLAQPDGKVLYSRTLDFFGTAVSRRLNADGSRDSTFAEYVAQFSSVRLVQRDGKIIVGGGRLHPDGTVDQSFRPEALGWVAEGADGKLVTADRFQTTPYGVRRLLDDGSIDETFAIGTGLTAIHKPRLEQAELFGNGNVAIAGRFNHVGFVPREKIAVLTSDGSLDVTFDPGAVAKDAPFQTPEVPVLSTQQDGRMFVFFNGRLVRLNPDGSEDTSFNYTLGRPGRKVWQQRDGKLLLNGPDALVRVFLDGTRDTSFQAALNAGVLFIQPDGKIMVLHEGRPTRLHGDGSVDSSFNVSTPVTGSFLDRVMAFVMLPNGQYVLSRTDLTNFRHLLFKLHADGSNDESFQPDIAFVQLMAADAAGIVVGGNIAPQADVLRREFRYGVARLNFDGTRDDSFRPVEVNPGAAVTRLLVQPDGNVIVAGSFTHVNGQPRNGIARIIGRLPRQLANISTRARVGTGDAVQIGGFIISGSSPKPVIVRAIGPSLGTRGIPAAETLQDPLLELYDRSGARIASNDDWRTGQEAEIARSGVAPPDDREAAITAALPPGAYTAVVSGHGGNGGVALVEVYDLDLGGDSQLVNISTRAPVGTRGDVMIGGFILGGNEASTVVIRGLGPSLAGAGIADVLSDPSVTVYDASGQVVAANDDWRQTQETELGALQMNPPDDKEAALVGRLLPGSYTTVIGGKNSGTGMGLLEVYRLE